MATTFPLFAYWDYISRSRWLGEILQKRSGRSQSKKCSNEENSWQLVGWVIKHWRSLLRKADTHNVPLFHSSLHKNLIYTLSSPSASLLIFIRACMFCCVVTDHHNYATERWHCVSTTEPPFCFHCSSPLIFHWSSDQPISTTISPTKLPSVETNGTREPEGISSVAKQSQHDLLLWRGEKIFKYVYLIVIKMH